MRATQSALLSIRDLRVAFRTPAGPVTAVDGVSLDVPRGKTVAVVGESGCGKSATALSIMRLLPEPAGRIVGGEIILDDPRLNRPVDIVGLTQRDMRRLRGRRMAMVFQEPMTSLNPVLRVGEQIVEAIELHQPLRGRKARLAAVASLAAVGIADAARRIRDYPHQLSGGMRQRVMIAMALCCKPALLIADEPTTALDVTIQAQILDRLRSIQSRTGLSILFITHDLGVVARIADFVYVCYAGKIVEHAPAAELFARPLHPYTQGLLRCTPRLDAVRDRLVVIEGTVPDPANPPTGCRYHPRCPRAAGIPGQSSAGRPTASSRCTATSETDALTEPRPSGSDAPTEPRRSGSGSSEARPSEVIPVEGALTGTVLRHCVEKIEGVPSGEPTLVERSNGHAVACWEA